MNTPAARRAITRELAAYATQSRFDRLPAAVQREAARTFLNWMGCALGGSTDPSAKIIADTVLETGAAPQATLIGFGRRADVAGAAFVNCMNSSALAFDDTHLATVTHPTGPVAAALFAQAEKVGATGEEFLNALALGIEIQCRLSNLLLMPPAQARLGLYITGITGPVGTAAAMARLLKLDEQRTRWAIGLGAAQAAGFRATHGSMAAAFVPAHAARTGVSAALLAARGLSSMDNTLEAPDRGFVDIFSSGADLNHAVEGLGSRFELMANAYKPYPCGIVIHPLVDACLELLPQLPAGAVPERIALRVHPLTITLTDRPHPKDPVEAQISLQHWAAVCFAQRAAGLAQLRQGCIDDPDVAALRTRVGVTGDATLQRDEAIAEATLADGRTLRAHVAHARGSVERPMTDAELDAKFLGQARLVLPAAASERLLELCRGTAALANVGQDIPAVWAA